MDAEADGDRAGARGDPAGGCVLGVQRRDERRSGRGDGVGRGVRDRRVRRHRGLGRRDPEPERGPAGEPRSVEHRSAEGRDGHVPRRRDHLDRHGDRRRGGAGVPDVEDGDAAAQHLLTGLRDSRGVFEDARDRVEAMSTDDPAAFGEELQTVGTDIQTSMSTIGGGSRPVRVAGARRGVEGHPGVRQRWPPRQRKRPFGVCLRRSYTGNTTTYGGVLASSRAGIAWEKRAEISGVSKNAGTNTSANDEYALAA